ncbi:glutamate/tyrosine decarboxylase-like PLP-dependent enzyme [Methylobacterium sp. RAS18]|jgi:glutamate/tyrosine decarboxylase-like PLP-dependent enzyme|nr:glutamate/tyrosine decarboxylase-like PLP-dependent enzyme [Methylobacterium sp. RAS18]
MKTCAKGEWPFTTANVRWVRKLWDAGRDTVEISRTTGLTEAQAYNLLAFIREQRHAARKQGGARA